MLELLKKRLGKFSLEVAEDKTRILSIGRYKGTKEDFDFLGFTFIRGHCNYCGVNGNFHAIQSFWKYLKYSTYRMLNRRHQKRSMRYSKFLRIWNYYVKEPHLTTDIWNWQPKAV